MDMAAGFIILLIMVLSMIFRSREWKGVSVGLMGGLVALRMIMALLLSWLYAEQLDIERKDADVFKYYDDAEVMCSAWEESPAIFWSLFLDGDAEGTTPYYERMNNWSRSYDLIQVNDNRSMIRLHVLMSFLTGGRHSLNVMLFSLIGSAGLFWLFLAFRKHIELRASILLVLLFCAPSVLLWSSGGLKESLVLLPLGLVWYGLSRISGSHRAWGFLTLGLLLSIWIKPYVLVAIAPVLVFLLLHRFLKLSMLRSSVGVLVLGLAALYLGGLHGSIDLVGILKLKQQDFVNLAQLENAQSLIPALSFDGPSTFLMRAPQGIGYTLFRPFPWEADGMFQLLSAAENAIYLLGLVYLVLNFDRSRLNNPMILQVLIFLLVLFWITGIVTPVLGALVRYRVPGLPFYLFTIFALTKPPALVRRYLYHT